MTRTIILASLLAGGVLAFGAAQSATQSAGLHATLAGAPQAIQPGMWEETRKLTVLQAPGMPPAMVDRMRRRPPITSHRCISAAEVAEGMDGIMKKDFQCPSDVRFSPGGGFDATAVCHQQDGSARFHFHGNVSPTAFSASGDGVGTGPLAIKVHSEMTGRLVGPCR